MSNLNAVQLASTLTVPHTVLFSAGAALVLIGTYLQLKVGHHRMEAEERMKDGKINEDQARWRVALVQYSARLLMLAGAAMFVLLFWT